MKEVLLAIAALVVTVLWFLFPVRLLWNDMSHTTTDVIVAISFLLCIASVVSLVKVAECFKKKSSQSVTQ